MRQQAILTALVVLAVAVGCSRQSIKEPNIADPNTEVRVYEVLGMDCPGCHGGVENLVLKIPAVLDAKASWKERRLLVQVRPGQRLDDELVYDAVRRANFTPGKRLE